MLKEIRDVFEPEDIETAPDDEREFIIHKDPSMWIRLYTYYNLDNMFDEILYFFKRDTRNEILYAVSFVHLKTKNKFIIRIKGLDYSYGNLRYEDPQTLETLEIEEGDLKPSDIYSLEDIVSNIFSVKELEVGSGVFE